MLNVPEQHRNNDVRRAQLRQMTLRRHDLYDGLAAEVLVQVLRNHCRNRQVFLTLYDVARDGDQA